MGRNSAADWVDFSTIIVPIIEGQIDRYNSELDDLDESLYNVARSLPQNALEDGYPDTPEEDRKMSVTELQAFRQGGDSSSNYDSDEAFALALQIEEARNVGNINFEADDESWSRSIETLIETSKSAKQDSERPRKRHKNEVISLLESDDEESE